MKSVGEWQHKLSYSLDQRNYGNDVVSASGGASLVPSLRVHPVSLGYSGSLRKAERDLSASVTLTRNLPGGQDGTTAAFNQPGGRLGADAAFTTLKFAANLTERFTPDWSARAAFSGQVSNDLLISAEQFGAGGADSVRGLSEREIAADRGARAGFEVWGPDFGARLAGPGLRLQPIAFLDAAWVRFNVAPGTLLSQSVSSIGLGLRGSFERNASFRFDYAYVLHAPQGAAGSAATTTRGSQRLHGSAMWIF